MARIYIDYTRFGQLGSNCANVSSKIDTIYSELQGTINDLDWEVSYQSDIQSTARKITNKMQQYSKILKDYQRFLDDALNEYKKMDSYDIDGTNFNSLWSKLTNSPIFRDSQEQVIDSHVNGFPDVSGKENVSWIIALIKDYGNLDWPGGIPESSNRILDIFNIGTYVTCPNSAPYIVVPLENIMRMISTIKKE